MQRLAPRPAHVVVAGGLALGLLAVCCGWPSYGVKSDVTDSGADEGTGDVDPDAEIDVAPYDSSPATCDEAGLKAGQATVCSCSGGDLDGGPDSDVGPLGQSPCTLEGGLGPCIGCPPAASCEGATIPPGTTCIPGGVTTLGAKNESVCPAGGCPEEGPEHVVAVSRFFLDDHEVTVRRFRDWWKNGHVAPKVSDVLFVAGDGTQVKWLEGWSTTEPTKSDGSNGATWLGETDPANDGLPINFVDWKTALAFCAATGGRLPTEAEWEAAASGRAGRILPREEPNTKNGPIAPSMLACNRVVSAAGGADCGPPNTATSGTQRFSVDGAYDLAGGLAEWVLDVPPPGGSACKSSCYPSEPTADPIVYIEWVLTRGVRGGAFNDTDPKRLRAQARDFKSIDAKSAAIGFRCARRS